ncbi:hypothetical protein OsccyDRAFT_1169 [Leptolyngbyaceae cyanobacterium JSC-12]|nr:hypothetical protein OsccyDRAFT_1169 [Leptolyngbyaceae cyanobacterium JSC-12]
MVKYATLTLATVGAVLAPAMAWAIAPVPGATDICSNFTAGKYSISPNQIDVRPSQVSARGQYVNWSIPRYRSSGYCFVSRTGSTTKWQVERGPKPENVTGGNSSQSAAVRAERACLNKAKDLGYKVYKQTAARPAGTTFLMDMEGTYRDQRRYELECRYAVIGGATTINRGVEVATGSQYPEGYSTRKFMGIPGYESGLRVKDTGYEDVSAKRRNFLVKTDASAIDFRWYADCTTQDQVYDGQKYLGYNPNARELMSYACSLPSTVRPQPR